MPPEDLPPFPVPPPGVHRLSHRPSVKKGLRYWRAILAYAEAHSPQARTAATLAGIYAAALNALSSGEIAVDR